MQSLELLLYNWFITGSKCMVWWCFVTIILCDGVILCAPTADEAARKRVESADQPKDNLTIDPHTLWNYKDQKLWINLYPSCKLDSFMQSPINIETARVHVDKRYSLEFVDYAQEILFKYRNTHHSVNMEPIEVEQFPTVKANWLPGMEFELRDIHFHWGDGTSCGSEHRINLEGGLVEAHLVHILKGLTKEETADHPGSILVIAVIIREVNNKKDGQHLDEQLDEVLDFVSKVNGHNNDFIATDRKNVATSLLPKNPNKFYAYNGSLTTPPCSEVVNWVVMADPMHISRAQINQLVSLRTAAPNNETHPIGVNHRTLQPIGARQVVASFDQEKFPNFIFNLTSTTLNILLRGFRSLHLDRLMFITNRYNPSEEKTIQLSLHN